VSNIFRSGPNPLCIFPFLAQNSLCDDRFNRETDQLAKKSGNDQSPPRFNPYGNGMAPLNDYLWF